MTTTLGGKESAPEHSPLSVFTQGTKAPRAAPDEYFDDVLPNLLLDVRETFLADFRSVFREFSVTDQQFRVLNILYLSGDLEIGKLARRSRIVAPSMTGILNRMSQIGWVARKTSKGQRWGRVSLTAEGRRLIKRLMPRVEERLAAIEAALGSHHIRMLAELLVEARTVLRSFIAEGPKTPATNRYSAPARPSRKRGTQSKRSASRPKKPKGG